MAFLPSTIPAGQVTLRGFEEDGIHKHSEGISSYQQLVNRNNLAANEEIFWELPISFQLFSVWLKTSTGLNETEQSAKADILINSLFLGGEFFPLITFNLSEKQIDSENLWIGWEPPLTILPKGSILKIKVTVATEIIYLTGKECYLNPVMYSSIV
jgi:hypothetical protein